MWYQHPHNKPNWRLVDNIWRKYDKKGVPVSEEPGMHEGIGMSKLKLRNIRRKQFFTFLEGFFDENN